MEIFKDVPNYEKLYQVSNLGRIKSLKFGKEKILKQNIGGAGYFEVNLYKNYKPKTLRIHVLIAITFLDHIPDGTNTIVVDHIDGNKLNNRLDNLQLLTNRKNSSKRIKNGSSKYTGVSWYKNNNKWKAYINLIGSKNNIHLGYFDNEQEAAEQYQKALKYILGNNLKKGDVTGRQLRKKIK